MAERLRYRLPHPIAETAGLSLVWDEGYTPENGVLGSFSVLRPHEIRLAAHACHNLPMIVGTLCHELRHMHQFRTLGWRYHLLAMPFLRNWTIEPSAYEVEEAADKLMERSLL